MMTGIATVNLVTAWDSMERISINLVVPRLTNQEYTIV